MNPSSEETSPRRRAGPASSPKSQRKTCAAAKAEEKAERRKRTKRMAAPRWWSAFWLAFAAVFVVLSTAMLYSSCVNAGAAAFAAGANGDGANGRDWHRERDRDRRYRQQLRRRHMAHNQLNKPVQNEDEPPSEVEEQQETPQRAPASSEDFELRIRPTEEPIEVLPEDEIINDDDEVLLPADNSERSGRLSARPSSSATESQQDHQGRFSPWSPSSWKRKFTSIFQGRGSSGGQKRKLTVQPAGAGNNQAAAPGTEEDGLTDAEREARFLNLFTVVRFNNSGCIADTGDNGTCYTANECARLGGAIAGTCAGNFGVCCVFIKTCGQNSSANCTYFVNQGYPGSLSQTGSCQLAINKCAPDVCQLRLDLLQFEIGGPSNDPTNAPTTVGQCLNDQFLVTSSGGSTTPVICGSNTGQHMYIDVSNLNQASVLTMVTSSTLSGVANRSWKIKVTQIKCGQTSQAISGCLQYFDGVVGRLTSFNYNNAQGSQLANQDYSYCIRMEAGFCGIKYTQCPDSANTPSQSFTVTGNSAPNSGLSSSTSDACATGSDKDWVTIPCGSTQSFNIQNANQNSFCPDRFCGTVLNPVSGQSTIVPVYSSRKPFVIYYHTDGTETGSTNNRGFCLDYVQQPCSPNAG